MEISATHEKISDNRLLKEMNIRVFQDGSLQKLAKTQNLTSTGMFIQTDALMFPKGDLIELVFEDFSGEEQFCVKEKEIHRSLKGIGVEFQKLAGGQKDLTFDHLMHQSHQSKIVA